ncbi:group II intron reverse transcriptase/maturase [Nonomuraea sp. M3C6]|uniref:Group II intron reverse transcriptase/maturase n=1 Tax=Nonomuraea marmarensis TaxID=3351344 RepID=A0ABW7AQ36_9ACTN
MSGPKSFEISKHMVYEAYRRVRANKGVAGVDGQSIEQFEQDLKGNLYKLWNRMSSGCYFPPPVRMVEISKPGGKGVRVLGVPTVADRIAQTVAAMALEPEVEKIFHPDSYGYRPRKSALDAVGACRERCWRTDWVIDLDIKGFFDNLDHDLVLKAVAHHTDQKWILLYVERWLKAPLQRQDGTLDARDRGSPQGSAISPLLANLFMHYAFDAWMAREYPAIAFERYCDDVVVHCRSEAEAHRVRQAIARRLDECGGLQLHPDKTRIVYCKDGRRRGSYEHTSFVFLGYGFRVRMVRTKHGVFFFSFNPAISDEAAKRIRAQIRSWRLHRRSRASLKDLAHEINAVVRGWINYYGRFYPSALVPSLNRINDYLVRWIVQKYKRYRGRWMRARDALGRAAALHPGGFVHWQLCRP